MAYTTKAIVRAATGFSDATKISDTTLDLYIADADSVINAKIADIYTLPLSETPSIIGTISRHITVALLYANEYGEESEETDKGWKKRMDWALKLLDDIQSQKIKLYTTAGAELARSSLKKPVSRPDDTSSDPDTDDNTAPYLTMNKEF